MWRKRDPFYTVGKNINLYSHYREQYGGFLKKKTEIELPYYPAIPFLGIYLDKTIIPKDTCTSMFTVALFAIARTWKQPKCPKEWTKKMWYIYTMDYHSVIKRNEIGSSAEAWIDQETITQSEWVRKRETNIVYIHRIDVESRKTIQMNLFAKQKERHRHREEAYGHQGGKERVG